VRDEGMDFSVLIPRKTLDVLPILGKGQIELIAGANHIFFSSATMILTSRTIDGKFPNYERVIPRGNNRTLTIDRSCLAAALNRISVTTENNCAVYCSAGPNGLRLSAKSAIIGEADEHVPAVYDGAEPLTVCVSWRYVLDFLSAAEGQTITVSMKDEKSPLLFSDGSSFINVIMTMKN
jgi:DNA polymerase-3 subunit beta